jgi:RNA polymerase primary sigma factor
MQRHQPVLQLLRIPPPIEASGEATPREARFSTSMRQDKVDKVVEALAADFDRQNGRLKKSQVERLVVKRNLSPSELRAVHEGLAGRNICPEDDDPGANELDAVEDGALTLSVSGDPLTNVLRRARSRKLLTAKEEVELGRRIQLAIKVRKNPDGLDPNDPTVVETLRRGEQAREQLITANLLLVLAWARRYQTSSFDLSDLFQEGVMGVMKAAERFDPELEFKFSTYATWWIRQSITRAIADKERLVRLPVHRIESIRKLRRAVRLLTYEQGGEEPTIRELSETLGWSRDRTAFVCALAGWVDVSIDEPVDEESSLRISDMLVAPDASALDQLTDSERRQRVLDLLSRLTDNQEEVLLRRFGFQDLGDGQTLQEIGDHFGLTRERIRQIEEKALKRATKKATELGLDEI